MLGESLLNQMLLGFATLYNETSKVLYTDKLLSKNQFIDIQIITDQNFVKSLDSLLRYFLWQNKCTILKNNNIEDRKLLNCDGYLMMDIDDNVLRSI